MKAATIGTMHSLLSPLEQSLCAPAAAAAAAAAAPGLGTGCYQNQIWGRAGSGSGEGRGEGEDKKQQVVSLLCHIHSVLSPNNGRMRTILMQK